MSSDTREKLLIAAKHHFLANGYSATSVDTICEQAGVSKGSFYHFFSSKEKLGLAVLNWSLETGGAILDAGDYQQAPDPVEKSLGFLRHLENSAHILWSAGCILATFSNELAESHPPLQKEVASMFDTVCLAFADKLEGVASQWDGEPTALDLAEELLIVIEGSVTLAKAYKQPERIGQAIAKFRRSVETRLLQSAKAA